jgi:hypothetical protein
MLLSTIKEKALYIRNKRINFDKSKAFSEKEKEIFTKSNLELRPSKTLDELNGKN